MVSTTSSCKEPNEYVRHRRAEAWWARELVETEDVVNSLKSPSRRSSITQERILDQIKDRLSKASDILERIMKKETYAEGDQELFAKAFDLMDVSDTGKIGYEIFWQALKFIGEKLSEADKQDLFNQVSILLYQTK